jgi:hypothetical protein
MEQLIAEGARVIEVDRGTGRGRKNIRDGRKQIYIQHRRRLQSADGICNGDIIRCITRR